MTEAPLRTLLVDDEPLAIERMMALCAGMEQVTIVGAANNGAAALPMVESLQPDLVLLDISMPELDGMAVARTLIGSQVQPAIIFVTAFQDFAVEAFDTTAVDYLLKPVARDRLLRAIERVQRTSKSVASAKPASDFAQEFWVPHRSELIRVAVTDIEKIEAERDYMRLFVGGRSYLLHQTISALEARLDPDQFLRLHRSIIVRKDCIARLGHDGAGTWHAELTGGEQLRIGRTYLRQTKAIAGK